MAVKAVSWAEEQLHDHFPGRPVMPAPLIIEGMAQTAGIMVGHARDFEERVILAKIKTADFQRDVRPGDTLIYTAVADRIDDVGAMTSGTVEVIDGASLTADLAAAQRQLVGHIDLIFSHLDQAARDLGLPEHNFVFTEQFMSLLRNSGF